MVKKTLEVFYKNGETYSITICPSDMHQFVYFSRSMKKLNLNQRYNNFRNYIIKCLKDIKSIEYKLYFELSEVKNTHSNKYPRLHLHGTITINSVEDFLLKDLYKLQQRLDLIDIDSIEDKEYWHKYCIKQQDILPSFTPLVSYKKEEIEKFYTSGSEEAEVSDSHSDEYFIHELPSYKDL